MNYFILLIGVLVGSVITQLLFYHKTACGYFRIVPYDEDRGYYAINFRIPESHKENLLKKDRIILYKEDSQN